MNTAKLEKKLNRLTISKHIIPMIEQIKLMMKFIGIEQFIIPNFGITFPDELLTMKQHWRPNRIWRVHADGSLSYEGLGYLGAHNIWRPNIVFKNIIPISPYYDEFIKRAHDELIIDCNKRIDYHCGECGIPNFSFIIKNFHRLDFLEPTP